MDLDYDHLLTPQEVADLLNMSALTLRDWRRKRINLPYVRIGNLPRYKMGEIEAFIDARTREVM